MCLNHPENHPTSMEDFSSTKPVPGANKVGDRLCSTCMEPQIRTPQEGAVSVTQRHTGQFLVLKAVAVIGAVR